MQPGYQGQPPPRIDNNMTMSVVSVFPFWPLAIPAIIQAVILSIASLANS